MDKNKLNEPTQTSKSRSADATQVSNSVIEQKTHITFLGTHERPSTKEDERILTIGDKIKQRFILDELLGVGGMGAVYRALDLRKQEAGDPQPYVAIKILGDSFKQHPRAVITLQREAKKTQQLAHPNIVTVYDFDRDGDLIYITMEELKGQSLSEFLRSKARLASLSVKHKSDLILQIAQALSYAHTKGLVHSDLKPANIFLTEEGIIKVLDFGIARAANQESSQDHFDAGELGAITPQYASLEMLNYEPPHPSDDVYALGLIACQLLGGSHPYSNKDAHYVFTHKIQPQIPSVGNLLLRRLLSAAITHQRTDRIQDATTFLQKFVIASKAPRRALIAFLLLVVLGGFNYYYVQTIKPAEVAFESLSGLDQQKFHKFIEESQLALSLGDLEGAAFNANRAYLLHQTHGDIVNLTTTITEVVNSNIHQAKTKNEIEFFEKQLKSLQEYPAFEHTANP